MQQRTTLMGDMEMHLILSCICAESKVFFASNVLLDFACQLPMHSTRDLVVILYACDMSDFASRAWALPIASEITVARTFANTSRIWPFTRPEIHNI